MAETASRRATYDDLYNIPENMIGEIIDGELIATPRPSTDHVFSASTLGSEILFPYHFGRGGPGGWIILDEPEIAFGENILVPDLAGWKRDRFAKSKDHNWISVSPDWVCEILSPGTFRRDKIQKMPIYAQYGVPHFWLVDPMARTLETYRLESGKWTVMGVFADNDKVRAEPFQEIEIELGNLWLVLPEEK
ncbi:MAG: hypothetical protein A2511_15220 [Deltaproteobacteria bacterium RIFOXYD12_FULL_50_9]|nr:MAG: hypothetical protein A2511_15220 [Deltaproteobacteria bacterium RIFOXYD12_FULL_50_9]